MVKKKGPPIINNTQVLDLGFQFDHPTVVGVDLSTSKAALSVISRTSITTRKLTPPEEVGEGIYRLAWMRNEIDHFLRLTQAKDVLIENYAFGKGLYAHQIGEIGGIIRYHLFEQNINTYLAAPGTIKKFVSGNGHAKKPEVILKLYKNFGIELPDEDMADAAGAALLCKAYKYREFPTTKYQEECKTKVNVYNEPNQTPPNSHPRIRTRTRDRTTPPSTPCNKLHKNPDNLENV